MSDISFFINLCFHIAIIRNIFLIFLTFFRWYQIFTRFIHETRHHLFVIVRCVTIVCFCFNEIIAIKRTFRLCPFFDISQFFLRINIYMTCDYFHIIVFGVTIRQFFRMIKTITWNIFLRFSSLIKR